MNELEFLTERIQATRRWTKGLLEDMPEKDWFAMPGGSPTHVAWQVGHLAASQASLVHVRCFEKPIEQCIPPRWKELFGIGSVPSPDVAAYPTPAELREGFDRVQIETIELLGTLPLSRLDEPPGPKPHPMFDTIRSAISMAFMHEAFHAGQIALLRRLLGKPALR